MAEKKTLLVVESPTKAKTINKYLGKNFIVEASAGHIKDLPSNRLGIDIENNFKPQYLSIKTKKVIIDKLKELAAKSENVLIATDPDREGEAIAWHIAEEIKQTNKNIKRVVFNEITKKNILKNLEIPRDIDYKMFLSQQARRVIDRIIGFKLSSFVSNSLLTKTSDSLSAGRVQSVALRMICEREKEIQEFEPIGYWNIKANFLTTKNDILESKLVAFEGIDIKNPVNSKKDKNAKKELEKHFIKTEEQACKLLEQIQKQDYKITDIKTTKPKVFIEPPFTTSKLQQKASTKLGFSNKKTMLYAQLLYEGINLGAEIGTVGLITYMRTDSVRVSNDAINSCREHIERTYGKKYLPDIPNYYSNSAQSGNIQDAHEAIRPTTMEYTPEFVEKHMQLNKDKDVLVKLYRLIYNRFLASQMKPAVKEKTTVMISSADKNFVFEVSGTVILFDGHLIVEDIDKVNKNSGKDKNNESEDIEKHLPKYLEKSQPVFMSNCNKIQSQTYPPYRYNSATLVAELEKKGIGRPSTYAQIVSTLTDKKYALLENKVFVPTDIGFSIVDVLLKNFNIFEYDYTKNMETDLDSIADGKITYEELLREFYTPFSKDLEAAIENKKEEPDAIKCVLCGGDMLIKVSRNGRFLGCSNYPECKNTKPLPVKEAEKVEPVIAEKVQCPECGSPMYIRNSKYGKFYGCVNYPNCKGTLKYTSEVQCPKCKDGTIITRYSPRTKKTFWGCSNYPECKFLINNEPVNIKCKNPECNSTFMEIRLRKVEDKYEKYLLCPKCKKEEEIEQ